MNFHGQHGIITIYLYGIWNYYGLKFITFMMEWFENQVGVKTFKLLLLSREFYDASFEDGKILYRCIASSPHSDINDN